MGGICITYGRYKNYVQNFIRNSCRRENILETKSKAKSAEIVINLKYLVLNALLGK
jgi:uncharacterized membrane protein